MDVLLDTCCLIWAVNEPEALSGPIRDILAKPDTRVLVSPISCAELACLYERKRVLLDRHWKRWFNDFVESNRWVLLKIGIETIQEAWSLPDRFHADPVDRILTATARLTGAVLLTADRKILDYPHVKSLW